MDLDIQKSHWSKILNGQGAHFPTDKFDALADLTGNEVPLQWWADRRGYELKRKLSAVEAENAQLRDELERERLKRDALVEALKR